jgi:hypothetical protein
MMVINPVGKISAGNLPAAFRAAAGHDQQDYADHAPGNASFIKKGVMRHKRSKAM